MQHLRDLNSGSGESYFVEAPATQQKGKAKLKLEDALREASLDDRAPSYQDQQDVPDVLAGFQPDMDPSLREVLEALDDEAYVDDEEDIFEELTGKEKAGHERFEELDDLDDLDDGWETDDTTKPFQREAEAAATVPAITPDAGDTEMPDQLPDHGDGAFMKSFTTEKTPLNPIPPVFNGSASPSSIAPATRLPPREAYPAAPSSIMTTSSFLTGGKRKKRKGAMTAPSSNYSMTSASLARTEGQTILDARFDKILEDYAEQDDYDNDNDDDDGNISTLSTNTHTSRLSQKTSHSVKSSSSLLLSSSTRASQTSPSYFSTAPPKLIDKNGNNYHQPSSAASLSEPEPDPSASTNAPGSTMRSDFNDIMDDFLENYSTVGRSGKRVKKGGYRTGMEQLDEIRKGLGPARVRQG